jgi:CubicO group peptidase (beta-lactamase class C family)
MFISFSNIFLYILTLLSSINCDGDVRVQRDKIPDWVLTDPGSVGLDVTRLQAMTDDIQNNEWGNIHAVLVTRDGKLVYEVYFNGYDEHITGRSGVVEFGRNVKHGLRSVSKSYTATLVGIALDQGLIKSVDVSLLDILPEYSKYLTGDKDQLSLKHLLTMSAGLRWSEGSNYDLETDDQDALTNAEDPIAFVLARESEAIPGETFKYSGGLTQVLAEIIQRVAGMSFTEYADHVLFRPLGIEDWEWITLGNAKPSAFSGLRLTARDMGKLGQVYLDKGQWYGQQIVSATWISQANEPYFRFEESGSPSFVESSGYGFHWWYDVHNWNGRSLEFCSAMGNGGQRIILIPGLDLMVVVFAGFYDDRSKDWVPEKLVREYILPAVVKKH